MIYGNYHTHTDIVHGKDSPEQMVQAAIQKGFRAIGLSEHCYTDYADIARMQLGQTEPYIAEVRRLKEKYRGVIDVYLGIESDSLCPEDPAKFDYVIGSAHAMLVPGGFCEVDDDPSEVRRMLRQSFGDSGLALARCYFAEVARMAYAMKPDILGHFDLVAKYNERERYFDEDSPAYRRCALDALDAVIDTGVIVEINTGAMARGARTVPYPAPYLIHRLYERHAPIILSSDAHAAEKLDYAFSDMTRYLTDIGFKETMALGPDGFFAVPLD